MAAKPSISIVGPGRVGNALAVSLRQAGYRIQELISRSSKESTARARKLARSVGARQATAKTARLAADVVWFCVPDRAIAKTSRELAPRTSWKSKAAFHSSGALASDELRELRQRGASIASVHPLMTFVSGTAPDLTGVAFAIEGDVVARRLAARIVRNLCGESFVIKKNHKAAYHAWGGFTSPLLVAMLTAGEEVAGLAGLSQQSARKKMIPIVKQTLANYVKFGAAGAFSGPMVRGDVSVVRKHLDALQDSPAREVYLALARAALRNLPVGNRRQIVEALKLERS